MEDFMVFRILFILILANACPALAMYKSVYKESSRQTRAIAPKTFQSNVPQIGLSEDQKAIAAKNTQMAYFKDLSKLETKLNSLVNKATDYPRAHNLIVLTIESNPVIKQEDKQELYNTYEEVLYKKFEHTFRKNPAQ